MKIKNPNKIEFICPVCKATEKIPLEIVKFLDKADQVNVDVNVNMELDKNVNLGIGQFCTNSFFIN